MNDEITVTMNSGEAVAVMQAIALRLEQLKALPGSGEEMSNLYTFVNKTGPLISQQAKRARLDSRDGLN